MNQDPIEDYRLKLVNRQAANALCLVLINKEAKGLPSIIRIPDQIAENIVIAMNAPERNRLA